MSFINKERVGFVVWRGLARGESTGQKKARKTPRAKFVKLKVQREKRKDRRARSLGEDTLGNPNR